VEVIRPPESVTGCRPSDNLLKRVQSEIDRQVKAFKERALVGRYQYLFLDAAWAKDIVGLSATRICILTAVGVTYSGVKEILGFERVQIENESSWRGFLGRIVKRGLKPEDLELVISDEHKGILLRPKVKQRLREDLFTNWRTVCLLVFAVALLR